VADDAYCPGCGGPAYRSQSRTTMLAILRDTDEPIAACGVGPWGYVCATKDSGEVRPETGKEPHP
jgi:hypothetical protein